MDLALSVLDERLKDLLVRALSEAGVKRPQDPIDFVAHFLLDAIASVQIEKDALHAKWDQEDAAMAKERDMQRQAEETRKAQVAAREEELNRALQTFEEREHGSTLQAMQEWVALLTEATNANVYIAEPASVEAHEEEEEEEEEEGKAMAAALYIAASKSQEFLFQRTLIQKREGRGAVFGLLKAPSEEAEEEAEEETEQDADEEEARKEKAQEAFVRRVVHIPNVLAHPKASDLQFLARPKVGSLLVFECLTPTLLHEDALALSLRPGWPEVPDKAEPVAEGKSDEEAAKEEDGSPEEEEEEEEEAEKEEEEEEEEKEEEEFEEPRTTERRFAVCLDTLGTANLFDAHHIGFADRAIGFLERNLLRQDRQEFLSQRKFMATMREAIQEYEGKSKQRGEEWEKIAEKLADDPEPVLQFKKAQHEMYGVLPLVAHFGSCMCVPKNAAVACMFLRTITPANDTLATMRQPHNGVFSVRDWSILREGLLLLTKDTIEKFDPQSASLSKQEVNVEEETGHEVWKAMHDFLIAASAMRSHLEEEEEAEPKDQDD